MKSDDIRKTLLGELNKILPDLVDGQRQGEDDRAFSERRNAAQEAASRIQDMATILNTLDSHPDVGSYLRGTTELREYAPQVVFDRDQLECVIGHALEDEGMVNLMGGERHIQIVQAAARKIMEAAASSEGKPLVFLRPLGTAPQE